MSNEKKVGLFCFCLILAILVPKFYYFITEWLEELESKHKILVSEEKVVEKSSKLYSLINNTSLSEIFNLFITQLNGEIYYVFKNQISEEPLKYENKQLCSDDYNLLIKDGYNTLDYAYIETTYVIKYYKYKKKEFSTKEIIDQSIVVPKNHVISTIYI